MKRFYDDDLAVLEAGTDSEPMTVSISPSLPRLLTLPDQTDMPNALSASRMAILADDSNLYHSARQVGAEFSYERLIGRTRTLPVAKAIAFLVEPDYFQQPSSNVRRLTAQGWQVFSKPLQVNGVGRKKGNTDIELACQAFALIGRVDTIILASGDGDFAPLVRLLRSHSVAVHILGFKYSTSSLLIQEADSFLQVGKDLLGSGGNGDH